MRRTHVEFVFDYLLLCCLAICVAFFIFAALFKRVEVTAWPRWGVEPKDVTIARQQLQTCPEERIGGGYRNGKFVYLRDAK